MKDTDKIFKVLTGVFSEPGCYHNKWIMDESLARIVLIHCPALKDIDNIRKKLVRRLNIQVGAFDDSNTGMIYHAKFQSICPYDGNKRLVNSYYFGTGRLPKKPTSASDVTCSQAGALLSFSKEHNRERSCNQPKQIQLTEENDSNQKKRKAKAQTAGGAAKRITPSPSERRKSRRLAAKQDSEPSAEQDSEPSAEQDLVPSITQVDVLEEEEETDAGNCSGDDDGDPRTHISWVSSERAILFGYDKDADVDVYSELEELVETLTTVIQSANGYIETNIIQLDKDTCLSEHAKQDLRMKCTYLRTAYVVALEELHKTGVTWKHCCDKAVSKLNDLMLVMTTRQVEQPL